MDIKWKFILACGIFPLILSIMNFIQLKKNVGTRRINLWQLSIYFVISFNFFIVRFGTDMLTYWNKYLFLSETLLIVCLLMEVFDWGVKKGKDEKRAFNMWATLVSLLPIILLNVVLFDVW